VEEDVLAFFLVVAIITNLSTGFRPQKYTFFQYKAYLSKFIYKGIFEEIRHEKTPDIPAGRLFFCKAAALQQPDNIFIPRLCAPLRIS
jgi:hypothetical protein